MTLQVGDRVKYVGLDEDYECAAGSVTRIPTPEFATVDLDYQGGRVTFHQKDLLKVSGRVVNEKWHPLRWPADMQDNGAKDHLQRQADKAAAIKQYSNEHRDPKYAPQAALPFEQPAVLPYKVYLAGPMRGYPRLNFPLFFQAAEILRALGFAVVNPAEMDVEVGVDKDQPDEAVADSPEFIRDAIFRDLRVVLYEADGVVTLPGSEESKGVAVELAGAEYAGLPVFSFAEFVTAALEER